MGWVILVGGGVGFLVVAFLSATGLLPRNRFVGVRTGATQRDDAAWTAAHRAAAPWWALSGMLLIVGSWRGWIRADLPGAEQSAFVASLVLVIVGGLLGHRAAKRTPEAAAKVAWTPDEPPVAL